MVRAKRFPAGTPWSAWAGRFEGQTRRRRCAELATWVRRLHRRGSASASVPVTIHAHERARPLDRRLPVARATTRPRRSRALRCASPTNRANGCCARAVARIRGAGGRGPEWVDGRTTPAEGDQRQRHERQEHNGAHDHATSAASRACTWARRRRTACSWTSRWSKRVTTPVQPARARCSAQPGLDVGVHRNGARRHPAARSGLRIERRERSDEHQRRPSRPAGRPHAARAGGGQVGHLSRDAQRRRRRAQCRRSARRERRALRQGTRLLLHRRGAKGTGEAPSRCRRHGVHGRGGNHRRARRHASNGHRRTRRSAGDAPWAGSAQRLQRARCRGRSSRAGRQRRGCRGRPARLSQHGRADARPIEPVPARRRARDHRLRAQRRGSRGAARHDRRADRQARQEAGEL